MVMFITLYKEFMSECQSSTAHAVACKKIKKNISTTIVYNSSSQATKQHLKAERALIKSC